MIGPDGVEVEEITRKDVKSRYGYTYIIKSSDAETNADAIDKRNKLTYLANSSGQYAQILNPKKMFEIGATIAGFSLDDIKEMLDVEAWGNADLMSEASRDMEDLIDGREVKPNQSANIAYKQKIVDWLRDHTENISYEQLIRITNYIDSLDDIIMRNTVRAMNDQMARLTMNGTGSPDMNVDENKTITNNTPPSIAQDVAAQQYTS